MKQLRGPAMFPPPILQNVLPQTKLEALHKQAQALEASFLSEMLSHTGLDASSQDYGGGIGEDQFRSFLREEQASLMVAQGGIGLSESLFRSLVARSND